MDIIQWVKNEINKISVVIIVILVASFLGYLSLQFGVTTHELGFHYLVAKLLGCEASASTNLITGSTSFENCAISEPIASILIALAAPIGAFFVGMFLWQMHKDSVLRLIGLFVMIYSAIPSLYPSLIGSDMYFAIQQGFNPIVGWIIFSILLGILTWQLFNEITEKQLLKIIKQRLK